MFEMTLFMVLYHEYLEWVHPHAGGVCIRFKFPNGYGADDVLGFQTEEDVLGTLEAIKNLEMA